MSKRMLSPCTPESPVKGGGAGRGGEGAGGGGGEICRRTMNKPPILLVQGT